MFVVYSLLLVLNAQLCPTLCDPMDGSLSGPSVHGILQARILEWVAMPSSRESSQPRDRTLISCIAGIWASREAYTLFGCEHYFSGQINGWFQQQQPSKYPPNKPHQVDIPPSEKNIFSIKVEHKEKPLVLWPKRLCGQFSCCFTSQKLAFQLPALGPPREPGELCL